MDSVRVEHDLPGEPAAVFEWFTDPSLLIRWWPSEAQTDPVTGGSYVLYWDGPDVTLRGEYLAVAPGERLGFTWSWDHDDLPPRRVDIGFTRSDRGTLVVVEHEAGSDDERSDYRDGWTHFLGQLAARLADS